MKAPWWQTFRLVSSGTVRAGDKIRTPAGRFFDAQAVHIGMRVDQLVGLIMRPPRAKQ